MISNDEKDKLRTSYETSRIHLGRMQFACHKIASYFPLQVASYEKIDEDTLSYFDQFIYRFSKLQDYMGTKLFRAILENLGEETRGVPYIDLLTKLEALGIINNADDWMMLREIRNNLAHEYPANAQEVIDGLNLLYENYGKLLNIWETTEKYILKKFEWLPG